MGIHRCGLVDAGEQDDPTPVVHDAGGLRPDVVPIIAKALSASSPEQFATAWSETPEAQGIEPPTGLFTSIGNLYQCAAEARAATAVLGPTP